MKMKYISFILMFFLSLPFLKGQSDSSRQYFKIGVGYQQLVPRYNILNLRFINSGASLNINENEIQNSHINSFGLDVGFIEKITRKGLIINYFDFFISSGSNLTSLEISSGIGYEKTLLNSYRSSARKKQAVLKFRTGLFLNYSYYDYFLKSIISQNKNPIYVNNVNLTNNMQILILDNIWKLTPYLGFNLILSSNKELRFYGIYNYAFYASEKLRFAESKVSLTHRAVSQVNVNEKDYLFDPNGNSINSVFKGGATFTIKIELALKF